MPVKLGFMLTDTAHFDVGIDKKLWIDSAQLLKNSCFFFVAQDTVSCAQCFDALMGLHCSMMLQLMPLSLQHP